ncbi:zinc finger C2HC domain-containing protein 1A-like isoform X2 [Varroa jacobsoni]|uniref:zinc finger C2HC domain-containing protein 1A-like isoform X2 n=1 Tax=Varroa jacobsoni TaxID=62625 RepID=UPI000BFA2CB1|nr:zinc finger C2HC domain-containing protein 1A-like isoform X2 [Varroa jacobsoni]
MPIDGEADNSPRIEDVAHKLMPCGTCGRKFWPEALARHTPICQKSKSRPKQLFDVKSKRREAIILDNNVDNAHEVFTQRTGNEQKNKKPGARIRRNDLIGTEAETLSSKAVHVSQSTGTLIQRKPASVPRGGQPKHKLESPKQPALVRRTLNKKAPIQAIVEKPVITTNNNNTVANRSRTPSRGAPRKRATVSPDVNGNDGSDGGRGAVSSRKTLSRNSLRYIPTIRRAVSSPHIDTNNNNKQKEGLVVKFKEKFPNHVNPNLDTFSAVFSKSQGQIAPISIRKPRTVPGVRTGGHNGVEFADPKLSKRPASSIELDTLGFLLQLAGETRPKPDTSLAVTSRQLPNLNRSVIREISKTTVNTEIR